MENKVMVAGRIETLAIKRKFLKETRGVF